MKLITKRIKVIAMTEEEMRKFHELMEQARQGHTSHYAEERLADGSYLGVQLASASAQAQAGAEERLRPREPRAF